MMCIDCWVIKKREAAQKASRVPPRRSRQLSAFSCARPSWPAARIAPRRRREWRCCVLRACSLRFARSRWSACCVAGDGRGFLRCRCKLAMAGFDVSELVVLSKKANELYRKSHYERSLEKWRAALAAAEALGAEDCVLVATLKTEVARTLYACESARMGVRLSQAVFRELLDLHAACAAILRRRRDAGTLLEGKCRPIEERWFAEFIANGLPQDIVETASVLLRGEALLVGYNSFLDVSYSCMVLLRIAVAHGLFERGGEAERAFSSFTCDLMDEAVALMVLPRVQKNHTFMEVAILATSQEVLQTFARAPEHREWHSRVAAALARLCQSGVLEKRDLRSDKVARVQARLQQNADHADRERDAAAVSGQLKSCALASCDAKEAHVSHFGKCSACKAVVYCCRDHQQADWPAHKAACKAARKAADAAAKDAA